MTMLNAHGQPRRRRCQLSVPGSNTKMIQKASESGVDHVFLNLEDACAPNQKIGARDNVVDALNNLECFMLTKPSDAPDVLFVDKLLTQLELELELGFYKKIGFEPLIQETPSTSPTYTRLRGGKQT